MPFIFPEGASVPKDIQNNLKQLEAAPPGQAIVINSGRAVASCSEWEVIEGISPVTCARRVTLFQRGESPILGTAVLLKVSGSEKSTIGPIEHPKLLEVQMLADSLSDAGSPLLNEVRHAGMEFISQDNERVRASRVTLYQREARNNTVFKHLNIDLAPKKE